MKKVLSALCLLTLLLSSCTSYKDLEFKGIAGFKINKINTEGIDGDVLVKIHNPNKFAFTVRRSEFDVRYSGVYLGKAKLAKKVRIKGNREETYAFNLQGDLKNTNLMDVMKLLTGANFRNEIQVKGDLNAGKFLLRRSFPIDYKDKIKLN